MMAKNRFDICLDHVLAQEGGYADHPDDPGGATNLGITRKTLARWRGISPWSDLPKSEVMTLAVSEAARIYRAQYWGPGHAGELPAGLDLAVFDFAVNSGPDRALRTLQAVLDVTADGVVGPQTMEAVRHANTGSVIEALCTRRLAFLSGLANFSVFGRGWTNRVAAIRAASLAEIQASQIKRRPQLDMLSGYRTYIVALFMLLAGIAQVMGIDLPSLDGGSAGQMVLEALAIIFLRKGFGTETRES